MGGSASRENDAKPVTCHLWCCRAIAATVHAIWLRRDGPCQAGRDLVNSCACRNDREEGWLQPSPSLRALWAARMLQVTVQRHEHAKQSPWKSIEFHHETPHSRNNMSPRRVCSAENNFLRLTYDVFLLSDAAVGIHFFFGRSLLYKPLDDKKMGQAVQPRKTRGPESTPLPWHYRSAFPA